MNELAKQIIEYSAAEQLAKDADFRGNSIDPYLERAQRYYGGDNTAFTMQERETMRVQELMLVDDETTVLEEHAELRAEYAASDSQQLAAASDSRNLDHYLQHGVEYGFAAQRIDELRPSIDTSKPVSAQLMRERVVAINGLGAVRMSVVYHDMMDHFWGMSQLRSAGLDTRYGDFAADVGNPFTGFLFSKQAELLSGIGYNTRRFITKPDHYGSMAASREAINAHLGEDAEEDERVAGVLEKINGSEDFARAAGFVINGAIGSLLLQRSRAGAVKKIVNGPNGPEITGTPEALMGSRYLSLMIDGTEVLLASGEDYQNMQLELNLTIESLLRECLERNLATAHLNLGRARDISNIPEAVHDELVQNAAVSTSYYA
jgi:hypothetical protein